MRIYYFALKHITIYTNIYAIAYQVKKFNFLIESAYSYQRHKYSASIWFPERHWQTANTTNIWLINDRYQIIMFCQVLLIFNSFDVKWKFSLLPTSKSILYSYAAHVVQVDKLARNVLLGMIDSGRRSSQALNAFGCQNFITLRQALSSPLSYCNCLDQYIGLFLYGEEEANSLRCSSRVASFYCHYDVWKVRPHKAAWGQSEKISAL